MVGAGTVEEVAGIIPSHAVPTTPRRIPKRAKIAITCTQVIRIFDISGKINERWEYSEKTVSVTRSYFFVSTFVVRQIRGLVTYSSFLENIQLNHTS